MATAQTSATPLVGADYECDAVRTGFRPQAAFEETPAGDRAVRRAVARAKEGDRNALHFLYVRYSNNVYGYVLSIVHDEHEAEDVTQHVFAKLMLTLPRYDQRAVPFMGWLLRIARNAAIDHLRTRRAIPVEEVLGADASADDRSFACGSALRGALESLPDDQREVLLLRHMFGYSPGEIADRMGRTESSVHGLHHRGRRALQDELRRLESGPATRRAEALAS